MFQIVKRGADGPSGDPGLQSRPSAAVPDTLLSTPWSPICSFHFGKKEKKKRTCSDLEKG